MNQTTSGCGNCYYYFNGQCTKADKCTCNTAYETITLNRTVGINEAYNPNVGINECGSNLPDNIVYNLPDSFTKPIFSENINSGFAIGKMCSPKTLTIENCDYIYLKKNGLELKIDFKNFDINSFDEIVINGTKFIKEKEE